jgi:hypothetical protein
MLATGCRCRAPNPARRRHDPLRPVVRIGRMTPEAPMVETNKIGGFVVRIIWSSLRCAA